MYENLSLAYLEILSPVPVPFVDLGWTDANLDGQRGHLGPTPVRIFVESPMQDLELPVTKSKFLLSFLAVLARNEVRSAMLSHLLSGPALDFR